MDWGWRAAEWMKMEVPVRGDGTVTLWTQGPAVEPLYFYIDELKFIPDAPKIAVVSSAGATLENGATLALGGIAPTAEEEVVLTVRNTGSALLDGLVIESTGVHAEDLRIERGRLPVSLAPGETGSVQIVVAPRHAGSREAGVRILSNDGASPWVVNLRYVGDSRFTLQPESRTVAVGTEVVLTAGAEMFDGSAPSFQWFKDGEVYSGGRGATLRFSPAMPWNAGAYRVQVAGISGPAVSTEATLRFTDAPSTPWRNVRSAYPFEGSPEDVVRPESPAGFGSDVAFVTDAQRGRVVEIMGKGFAVPPFEWEPLGSRGPGGTMRLPRPMAGAGEPFTLFFWIQELGYSVWHGESFFTLGEGLQSADLLGHYWVGGLSGIQEFYGTERTVVTPVTSDPTVVTGTGEAVLNGPWTSWAIVGEGEATRIYRNGLFVGPADYPRNTQGDLLVGTHWWTDGVLRHSTRLRARLDDVRVLGRALTAVEVAQLHTTSAIDPLGAYASWAQANGLSGNAEGLEEDPDRDGFSNFEECAFGTAPGVFTAGVATFATSREGSIISWVARPDFYYEAEASYDAVNWSPSPFPIATAEDQTGVPAGYVRRQLQLPLPSASDNIPVYMARIRAESPPIFLNDGLVAMEPGHGEPLAGESFRLAAALTGHAVKIQWYRDGIALDGETGATLTVPSAGPGHTGTYYAVATNRAGSSTGGKVFILVR